MRPNSHCQRVRFAIKQFHFRAAHVAAWAELKSELAHPFSLMEQTGLEFAGGVSAVWAECFEEVLALQLSGGKLIAILMSGHNNRLLLACILELMIA